MDDSSTDSKLAHVLRFGAVGLLLGPGVTAIGWQLKFQALTKERFATASAGRYFDVVDAARSKGTSDGDLRSAVRAALGQSLPHKDLPTLATVRWSAVLSASIDHRFESLLVKEADRNPQRPGPIVLDDATIAPPPRSVPIFKLLGSAEGDRFILGSVDYLRASRTQWRRAAAEFAQRVKAGAVVCLGFDDALWALHDIVAELIATKATSPSVVVLLKSEQAANDATTRALLEASSQLLVLDETIVGLVKDMQTARAPISARAPSAARAGLSAEFGHLLVDVGEHTSTKMSATERRRLRDLLFSPVVPRWDPYCYDLDFRRTVGAEVEADLLKLSAENTGAVVVTGNAATGKTTLLKRVAFALARAGRDVVWFKSATSAEWATRLPSALRLLARPDRKAPVFAFVDDPFSLGSVHVRDVWNASLQARVPVVIVVSARTSDWSTRDTDTLGSTPLISVQNLPDDLDEIEWAALPQYLHKLEIVSSPVDAQSLIDDTKTRHASDTLSMLYWLLQDTRGAITSSVKQEYFRLGDMAAFARVLIGEQEHSTELLKRAYAMVAVADHYRAPLPLEVLVGALDVSYREWVDAWESAGNGWGLLYADMSEEEGTSFYRTRNDIVTKILLETINEGVLGHSAEVPILHKMLSACTGSNPVYRDFCVQVLVKNAARDDLDYTDGLKLFAAAESALPFPDKTLVHHRAIWVREKGNDPLAALTVLQEALATTNFPYAKRAEADEHIYTSIAATTLDGLDRRVIGLSDAKTEVLANLSKARSASFLNPSAVHVQAGLIVRLLDKVGTTGTPDSLQLMARSLADIDHTLMSLRDTRARLRTRSNDAQMLEDARDKIIERSGTIDELLADAAMAWKNARSQQGFCVACRRFLAEARSQGKGSAFNRAMTYAQKCIADVRAAKADPAAALFDVAAQILYEWRISGAVRGEHRGKIDWAYFLSLVHPALQDLGTPLLKYFEALAYAHMLRWPEANALFADIRRSGLPSYIVWAPRDHLLDEEGNARSVQGVVKRGVDRLYFKVDELQTDFQTQGEEWPREGELGRGYVSFAFGGPRAIRALPLDPFMKPGSRGERR